MPFGQGSNPYMTSNNWVGSWGQMPQGFGHTTPQQYFQQNPNMIGSYYQGHGSLSGYLGREYPNWFNSQVGGAGTPRPQPRPQNPILNAGGFNPRPSDIGGGVPDIPNVYNPYTPPPTPNTPGLPKYGLPQTAVPNPLTTLSDYRFGGGLPPTPKFPNPQPGPGGYRGGGWF